VAFSAKATQQPDESNVVPVGLHQRAKLSSFQCQGHRTAWNGTRRAKCANIRNSRCTPCGSMCWSQNQHFVCHKNTFKRGKLQAKTFQQSQKLFVEQTTMKAMSAKMSLLHFLCWTLCSLRAGFTNQSSPFKLPPVLAVCVRPNCRHGKNHSWNERSIC